MLLHKVILNNYKVYYGEHSIDCSLEGSSKPIILIGGATGAGKTSILESIKLCLYGMNNKQLLKGYQSYNKYLSDIHNKKAKQQKKDFSVSIEYKTNELRDIDIYKIDRKWSLINDKYKQELNLSINGEPREGIDKSDFQGEINKYFPIGIGEMLLFDSEQYNRIPDFLENGFISSLNKYMGIDKYRQLNDDLVSVRRHHLQENDPDLAKTVKANREEISGLQKKNNQNNRSMDTILEDIKVLEKNSISIKKKLKRQSGRLALQQEKMIEQKGKLKEKTSSLREEQKLIFSNFNPFYIAKDLCLALLAQLDAEENLKSKKIIIRELKKVGRNLKNELKNELSKKQLEKMNNSLQEQIKSYSFKGKIIHDISLSEANTIKSDLKNILKNTKSIVEEVNIDLKRVAQDQINIRLKERTINPQGPGGKLYSELNLTITSIDKNREMLKVLGEENAKLYKDVEKLELESTFLHNKVELESNEQNKSDLINKTMHLLDDFTDYLTNRRFETLRKTFLKTLKGLSTKGDLVSNIHIDQENKKLLFLDSEHNKLNVKDFSAGESEIVAFSLLWAVNITSNKFYPIVTDSPFNRLDSTHRKQFIEKILKKSKSQIIFLSTDKEIDSNDYYGIKNYISKTYLIKHNKMNKTSKIVGKSYFVK